jgi:hypothetical protein
VSLHLSAWPPSSAPERGPVRRSTLREMQSPQFGDSVALDESLLSSARSSTIAVGSGYGYGLRNTKKSDGSVVIGHAGGLPGFGSDYRFFPDKNGIAVISMSNRTYAPMFLTHKKTLEVISRVTPKVAVPVSAGLEDRYIQLQSVIMESAKIFPGDPRQERIWTNRDCKCFADNFFLDFEARHRVHVVNEVLKGLGGKIEKFTDLLPMNYLRGSFKAVGVNGRSATIFFTLTPESDPKIQEFQIKVDPLAKN